MNSDYVGTREHLTFFILDYPLMLAVVTPCARTLENPTRRQAMVTSKFFFIKLGFDFHFLDGPKYPFTPN